MRSMENALLVAAALRLKEVNTVQSHSLTTDAVKINAFSESACSSSVASFSLLFFFLKILKVVSFHFLTATLVYRLPL